MEKQYYKLIFFWIFLASVVMFLAYQIESSPDKSSKGSFLSQQYLLSKRKAQFKELNLRIPSKEEYESLLKAQDHKFAISTNINAYYSKIVETMPDMVDGYSMLGFCYYYQNDYEKSAESYMKAIALNPELFWNYYNLAAILLEKGAVDPALGVMTQALRVDPKITLMNTYSSKIYRDIIMATGKQNYDYSAELLKAYQNLGHLVQTLTKDKGSNSQHQLGVRFF